MKKIQPLRKLGKLSYVLGVAFLIASLATNLLPPMSVLAGAGGGGGGNPGAIWTTGSSCNTDPQQDDNSYNVGETVYINGGGFDPNTAYNWDITGQPGGASSDPNVVVASGTVTSDGNGDFCINAYTILQGDDGVYQVKVGTKGDNYSVIAVTPTQPPATETQVPTEPPTETQVPTEPPTETQVPTEPPTETPVPTEPPTETQVPTEPPTETPVPTATPLTTLELEATCNADGQITILSTMNYWVLTNPNAFDVNIEYGLVGGDVYVGTVPALSQVVIMLEDTAGNDYLRVWVGGEIQATVLEGDCDTPIETPLPTEPPATDQPTPTPLIILTASTPVPFVPVTGGDPSSPVLIPVTGVDQQAGMQFAARLSFYLGIGFIGLGLVTTGLNRKKQETPSI